jgi:hypothetical protein
MSHPYQSKIITAANTTNAKIQPSVFTPLSPPLSNPFCTPNSFTNSGTLLPTAMSLARTHINRVSAQGSRACSVVELLPFNHTETSIGVMRVTHCSYGSSELTVWGERIRLISSLPWKPPRFCSPPVNTLDWIEELWEDIRRNVRASEGVSGEGVLLRQERVYARESGDECGEMNSMNKISMLSMSRTRYGNPYEYRLEYSIDCPSEHMGYTRSATTSQGQVVIALTNPIFQSMIKQ